MPFEFKQVRGDLSDIFVGHNTWSTFYTMNRVYKHYDFSSLSSPHACGKRISMSSFPGDQVEGLRAKMLVGP